MLNDTVSTSKSKKKLGITALVVIVIGVLIAGSVWITKRQVGNANSIPHKIPAYAAGPGEKLENVAKRYDGPLAFTSVTAKSASFGLDGLIDRSKLEKNIQYLRINIPEWDPKQDYTQLDHLLDNVPLIDLKTPDGKLIKSINYAGNFSGGTHENCVVLTFNASDIKPNIDYFLVRRGNDADFRVKWIGLDKLKVTYYPDK